MIFNPPSYHVQQLLSLLSNWANLDPSYLSWNRMSLMDIPLGVFSSVGRSKYVLPFHATETKKLFMSFCTIFLYVILGWYHDNLGWKCCLLFSLRKRNMFFTNKNWFVYRIFINKFLWYHPKIIYKNIVQKDMNKFQDLKDISANEIPKIEMI